MSCLGLSGKYRTACPIEHGYRDFNLTKPTYIFLERLIITCQCTLLSGMNILQLCAACETCESYIIWFFRVRPATMCTSSPLGADGHFPFHFLHSF